MSHRSLVFTPIRRRVPAVASMALVALAAGLGAANAGAAGVQKIASTSDLSAGARSAKVKAHAKVHPRRHKTRRGSAARREVSAWPIVHFEGMFHGPAPESGKYADEDWVEYGDLTQRFHERITALVAGIPSLEDWDTPEISIGATGDLHLPLADRLTPNDVVCMQPPQSAGEWSSAQWENWQRAEATHQRDVVEHVDALQRDPAGRAALPAGPTIDGRATVVWSSDRVAHSDAFGDQPEYRYFFDAATGRVVRRQSGWPDSWVDFTSWEILPAGSDVSVVSPPADVVAAAHCH